MHLYRFTSILWCLAVALVFFALVMLIRTVANPWGSAEKSRNANKPPVNLPTASTHSTTNQANQANRIEVRDQFFEASRLLSSGRVAADKSLAEMETWSQFILPEIKQSKIENVDQQSHLIEMLDYVVNAKRATKEELLAVVSQLEQFSNRVDALSLDDEVNLTVTDMKSIRQLHWQANQSSTSWSSAVKRAKLILDELGDSGRSGDSPTPGQLIEEHAGKRDLAKLSQEMIHGPPTLESTAPFAGEFAKPLIDPVLRERALSAETKIVLAPLLEHRNKQPRLSGGVVRFEKMVTSGPMSLSRLRNIGALDESTMGLKRLVAIGAHRKLEEPRWHIHLMPNNWSEADVKFLKHAQKLLRIYGQTLANEQLLSN